MCLGQAPCEFRRFHGWTRYSSENSWERASDVTRKPALRRLCTNTDLGQQAVSQDGLAIAIVNAIFGSLPVAVLPCLTHTDAPPDQHSRSYSRFNLHYPDLASRSHWIRHRKMLSSVPQHTPGLFIVKLGLVGGFRSCNCRALSREVGEPAFVATTELSLRIRGIWGFFAPGGLAQEEMVVNWWS